MKNAVQPSRKLWAEIALMFVVVIWGINPTVMKIGLQFLPPQPYNLARMVMASVVALIALWLSSTYRRPSRADLWTFLRISACGFFVFQIFIAEGLSRTTAGNASFIMCLLPVGVALLNWMFGLESIGRSTIIGIAVSIFGVLLIVLGSGKELSLAGNHLWGALLVLLAEAGYAYYTVFSKDLLARYSAYQVSAILMVFSTTLLLCTTFPSAQAVQWKAIPAAGWVSVFFSGILALCMCNFLWIWVTAVLGTSRVAVFHNVLPVFSVAAAYFMLGEEFGVVQTLGALFIILGVLVTRKRPAPEKSTV